MRTKVRCTCVSKKEEIDYSPSIKQFVMELAVPYEQDSVYFKQSGGTNMELRTINQEAAAMFNVGDKYDFYIEPAQGK